MKNVVALISAFLVLGCSADDSGENGATIHGLDYYRFTSADSENLLNSSLNKGKTISFINQSGETISYKVKSKFKYRASDVTGSFSGGGVTNFYFDVQSVTMEAVGFGQQNNTGIALYVYKTSATAVWAEFNFDRWNDGGYWGNERFILSNAYTQPMTFNGTTYPKVMAIDSGTDDAFEGNGFPMNVSKVYYDINFGIVGFDDVDGNQWRRD